MVDFTWVGNQNNDFTDALNWTTTAGLVPPDATSTVFVNGHNAGTVLSTFISGTSITPSIIVGSLTIGGVGAASGGVLVGDGGGVNGDAHGAGSLTSVGEIKVTATADSGGLVGGVGGTISAPTLTVGLGATIGGGGTFIIPNLVNDGRIQADGGSFALGPLVVTGGSITGSGIIEVNDTSTFELGSATSQNIFVNETKAGQISTIILDNPTTFTGSLTFSNTDTQVNLVLAPPAPDTLSSADVARILGVGNNTSLQFVGAEAAGLVDGTLSAGADTNEAYIARLYQGLLGRAHDGGGLSGWDTALNGSSKAAVAQAFLDSGEYQAVHAGEDDATFVNSLYLSTLGRPADTDGAAGWTQALAGGTTRGDVAAGFTDSAEAKLFWSPVTSEGVFSRDPNAAIVREDYLAAFGREAEIGGLAGWKNFLNGGGTSAQVAQGLAGSAEFQALHGSQADLEYVQSLYLNGLGREAEAGGAESWVTAIQSGANRGDVLAGIAQSAEGQQHLQWALA